MKTNLKTLWECDWKKDFEAELREENKILCRLIADNPKIASILMVLVIKNREILGE